MQVDLLHIFSLRFKNIRKLRGLAPSNSPITDPPEGGRKIPPKVKNELVGWMSGFDFEVEIFQKKKFQAQLGNFLEQKMRADKRSASVVFCLFFGQFMAVAILLIFGGIKE
jgi:hypothetical protein